MKRFIATLLIPMVGLLALAQPSKQVKEMNASEPVKLNESFSIDHVYLFIEDTLVDDALEINHILLLTSKENRVNNQTREIEGAGPYMRLILSPEDNALSKEYGLAPLTPEKSFAFGEYLYSGYSKPICIFQSGKLTIEEQEDEITIQVDGHLLSPKADYAMYIISKYKGKCEKQVRLDGK